MKPFSQEDVQAAHNELRPLAQKLVDRFGQTQAFEILSAVAESVCPDGRNKAPRFIMLRDSLKAAN